MLHYFFIVRLSPDQAAFFVLLSLSLVCLFCSVCFFESGPLDGFEEDLTQPC